MARRRRLLITPDVERIENYNVGVDVGPEKLEKKRDRMREHAKFGLQFTAKLDNIISSVLDRYGIIGQRRIKYFIFGRKAAKVIVGYHNVDDDVLRDIAAGLIRAYRVQEGIREDVAADIAEALISQKEELYKTYQLGE